MKRLRKAQAASNGAAAPKLTAGELVEYKLRMAVMQQQEQLARACKISLQVYQDHLQKKYGMGELFNINIQTGELTHG